MCLPQAFYFPLILVLTLTQLELYVSISVALNYEVYVAKAYFQDETEYQTQI